MAPSEASPLVSDSRPASTLWVRALAGIVVGGAALAFWTVMGGAPAAVFCDVTRQESGYIQLPHKVDDHYFYWFFESRSQPATDPLVLWLNGGPGSSSLLSLLSANGPCTVDASLNTVLNPHSWTSEANVIWLDQPTGVGFSYSNSLDQDDDHNETDVGRNVYAFLQAFLAQHPQFQTNPFFLTGESFAGHYIPASATYILAAQQKQSDDIPINLRGIAIGNGFTDSIVQVGHAVDIVDNPYNVTLVDPTRVPAMRDAQAAAVDLVQQCQTDDAACVPARDAWQNVVIALLTDAEHNEYDLREDCSAAHACIDHMQHGAAFLNSPAVQAKLHVRRPWHQSNSRVMDNFGVDFMKNYVHLVPPILAAGVRVLIYAGDADAMCNFQGIDAWTKALAWPHHMAFNNATETPLQVHGHSSGVVRSSHNLSFVRIFHAGHMVPMDQPEVSLALMNRFFHDDALDHE
ncbi:Aste57867_10144 [Aphanomyces stellatus]|uniref:Aste57867_10144 protein n=1 Tax=Aphanomyces stellatus TaxID=120398 RepID=A0A485KPP8_9STRA|nr:hypothetical protein As57867_010105 [Aphanomyces stellatus]VFT87020.1 Aste57867_10144 [Aphanomyces stellatus]